MRGLNLLCLLALLLALVGCYGKAEPKPEEIEQFPEAFDTSQNAQSSADDSSNPVAVNVAQAFVDAEKNLHVKVHVEARTDVDPRTVKLFFRGLNEGEVVEEEVRILSNDSDREMLAAGETVVSRFIVSAEELSEYQVECAWGQDVVPEEQTVVAAQETGKLSEMAAQEPVIAEQESGKLADLVDDSSAAAGAVFEQSAGSAVFAEAIGGVIRVLEVDSQPISCSAEPCNVKLVVTAVLRNAGNDEIRGAKVAVGLVWRGEGQPLPAVPDSSEALPGEDVIELSNLAILPNDERKMRLRISEEVPVVPGGQFEPTIRLLSLDTAER